MNEGYTGAEIANMIKLPPELDQEWYNRGYYGTVKHDSRAVYQRYMGFYDGNPITLDQLPPEAGGEEVRRVHGRRRASCRKPRRTSTRANTDGSPKR